jgi:beta-lactamase class A
MSKEKKKYTYQYAYNDFSNRNSNSPKKKLRKRDGRRRQLWPMLLLLLVLVGLALLLTLKPGKSKPPVVAKVIPAKTVTHTTKDVEAVPIAASIDDAKISTMNDAINSVIQSNGGVDISVSLIDLSDNNQLIHYGDPSSFTAASTTKIITAADFLHQVELGQASLSQTINGASAQYEIQRMIVVSDDNAWNAFRVYLGYDQLQQYAANNGLSSYVAEPNTVTSSDMALLLQKLYEGQLLNSADTQLVLSYMQEANYRQYIVPAVPAGDTVYHKVGFYLDDLHDEAIITDGSKSFVIVIFTNTNTTSDYSYRAGIMQQITKAALAGYF